MLRTASHLKGTSIAATDGEIGSVQDLYFDDHSWTIRYLVVDTGTWLPGRQVLISPRSIMAVTDEAKIPVSLTKSQVENSPSTDVDKPVERQYEEEYSQYYGYPYYWTGPYRWGATPYPGEGVLAIPEAAAAMPPRGGGDPSLRSTRNVTGYYIEATDGDIGHVDDFIVDTTAWAIRYMLDRHAELVAGQEGAGVARMDQPGELARFPRVRRHEQGGHQERAGVRSESARGARLRDAALRASQSPGVLGLADRHSRILSEASARG